MGKGMNTLKPIKDATTSFSRSVLGTLLFAFGLFLCSSFSAQAHIDNDVSRQFEALLEAAPSADVFKAQHSELEGNDIGPQLQRFDAVDEDSALVERPAVGGSLTRRLPVPKGTSSPAFPKRSTAT